MASKKTFTKKFKEEAVSLANKQELLYHRQHQTRKKARQDIFEYIQVWYNGK